MVELNKCNLHSVTFCFPKTQSERNHFGPPTYVRSSLPEKSFTEVNEMAEWKTSVVCSQLIKHLYRVCWIETLPKSAINHLGLEGDPITKIIIMLFDNNTNTEKTLNVDDKYSNFFVQTKLRA